MRLFFDSECGSDLEGNHEFRGKATNAYFEAEWRVEEGFLVAYFMVVNDHTLCIAANWGDALDFTLEHLQDESGCELLTNTWPLLAALIAAGMDGRFSGGCLQRLQDYDSGDPTWMLCTLVPNLDLDDPNVWFSDRIMDACKLMFTRSNELFTELSQNRPNELTHYGKQALKWVGNVAARVALAVFLENDE